eukprot:3215394-Rhodomonas_salina.1
MIQYDEDYAHTTETVKVCHTGAGPFAAAATWELQLMRDHAGVLFQPHSEQGLHWGGDVLTALGFGEYQSRVSRQCTRLQRSLI